MRTKRNVIGNIVAELSSGWQQCSVLVSAQIRLEAKRDHKISISEACDTCLLSLDINVIDGPSLQSTPSLLVLYVRFVTKQCK